MWMVYFMQHYPLLLRYFSNSSVTLPKSKMTETRRLLGLAGFEDRKNDVICGSTDSPSSQNVVFFGGDVQDYTEVMMKHRDNKHYTEWSYDETAKILHNRFPSSHVWVVRPKAKALLTFSIYSNLVPSVDLGNPQHVEGFKSWHHLRLLLENAVRSMQENSCESKDKFVASADTEEVYSLSRPISLVGFSKGCIVLNQLLYDLQEAKQDLETSQFVRQVRHMYWLDGGHNGGSNTWIVHENILKHLTDLDIEVHSHVTPYQIKDSNREWIAKEQKKFVSKLRKLGVKVNNTVHFEEEDRSIDNHFQILKSF